MKRIMTKVKYLRGQMLRFISAYLSAVKFSHYTMAFWFITASIFRHSIITFSLKRSKRGMASILIGSRSIPFLGNRRYNATVVRAGLWSLPRCLLWIEIVEFVTRNLTPWTITTEPADFFPKYTKVVLRGRRK